MQAIDEVIPGVDIGNRLHKIAEHQPEYETLPCYLAPDGCVTIRWKLTWRERLSVLMTGSLWHQVLTFNHKLQPIKLTTDCPITEADLASCSE